MRLDKFLCDTKGITRKEAKDIVKRGQISVDGKVIKDSGFNFDPDKVRVSCGNEELFFEEFVYYMLNKPAGVVSATEDKTDKTVIDLFSLENKKGLFPVGRLDKDTVGLLLVTNDGAFGHHLTAPSHNVTKKYYVKTKAPITSADKAILENGIMLKNDGMTGKAVVEIISDEEIYLTISEGMYHQVKRMLKAVNNEVLYLKRVSIGSVNLDPDLAEGSYRRLSLEELSTLRG